MLYTLNRTLCQLYIYKTEEKEKTLTNCKDPLIIYAYKAKEHEPVTR